MSVPVTSEERNAINRGTVGLRAPDSQYWRSQNRLKEPSLRASYLSDKIRYFGLKGNAEAMFRAIAEAKAFLTGLRNKPHLFRASRGDVVKLDADLLRFGEAAHDFLRFVPDSNPAQNLRQPGARLEQMSIDFKDILAPAADWLDRRAGPDAIEQADIGFVMRFSAFAEPIGAETSPYLTKFKTMDSVVRLALKSGLRVAAIPDFAFSALKRRPAQILSFHTAGEFPGFVHFKRGDLPRFMILDSGGYSGWSSLSGTRLDDLALPSLEEAEPIFKELCETIVEANVSTYIQADIAAEDDPLPENYVFVPLQVKGDSTQQLARIPMARMLDIVIQRFLGTETVVVVKPHPKEADLGVLAQLMRMAEDGQIVLRFDSIHHLIKSSQAVITINSGVGSETILHRKPLYCFGAADYDAVAHRIYTAEQFIALTNPIRPAVSDTDLVRFSAYYRKKYLVEWDVPGRMDEAMQERVINPILRAVKA